MGKIIMEELEQLLNAAMASLEIQDSQDPSSHKSVDEYRVILKQCWEYPYAFDSIEKITSLTPFVADKAIRSELLNFMRNELEEFIYEDHMLPASYYLLGGTPNGYHINMFLEHLLNTAICYGVKEATLSFERSTKKQASFQYMALLEGIHVDDNIQICKGINLFSLSYEQSKLPSCLSSVVSYMMPSYFFTGKTLLVIDASVSPILNKPCRLGSTPFQSQMEAEKFQKLDIAYFCEKFCHSMSLVCNTAVYSSLEWNFLRPSEFFNLNYELSIFQGMCIVTHTLNQCNKVKVSEVTKSVSLCERMIKLSSDTAEKLQIPIGRWVESKKEKNYVDKIIDLGIALEAIYLSEIDSELSFRLALHAARYLGEEEKDQKKLFKELRVIYNCRSKIIHGNKLKLPVTIIGERPIYLQELTERTQYLCKESIMKILEEGKFPNWDDLIFN